ncbi:unnamed protein product [marine sediment metagenome]|uniref:Uncharacterized protein n=1 Tax=marine sediment metagenome TaxID=412755 RepID=X0SMM6_9ZZZZ
MFKPGDLVWFKQGPGQGADKSSVGLIIKTRDISDDYRGTRNVYIKWTKEDWRDDWWSDAQLILVEKNSV